MRHCIACDLDGTLAEYEEWHGPSFIGSPIPLMVDRLKKWIAQGHKVVIFTARASYGPKMIKLIKAWLKLQGLPDLEVTNIKKHEFDEIWDDKAVTVKLNVGIVLTQGR